MNKKIIYIFLVIALFSCNQNPVIKMLKDGKTFSEVDLSASVGVILPSEATMVDENGDSLVEEFLIDDEIPAHSGITVTEGTSRDRITLSWNPVVYGRSEVRYHIYRSTDAVTFSRITGDNPLSYGDFSQFMYKGEIVPGDYYYYALRSIVIKDKTASRLSMIVRGYTLGDPSRFSVTQRAFSEKVILDWDVVPGAKYYTLYRLAREFGEEPPEFIYDYEQIGGAITENSYVDYSVDFNGKLIPQKEYWYVMYAHLSAEIFSNHSSPAKGSILAVGAPPQISLLNVTKGLARGALKIQWEAVEADSYIIYRITQEDISLGNYYGTELVLDNDHFMSETLSIDGSDVDVISYFDSDAVVSTGNNLYYRISGKNSIGLGKCSLFETSDDRSLSLGYGIAPYSGRDISVYVTQLGFSISWDSCLGASSYYIFRAEEDPSGYTDDEWTYVGESTSNAFLDDCSTVVDPLFNLESSELYYRIIPVNGAIISKDTALNSDSNFEYFAGKTLADLNGDALALGNPITMQFGISDGFSAVNSDYTVPVPLFSISPVATEDDDNYIGRIKLSGTVGSVLGMDKLRVKLIRTCRYGDESGVFPLTEPRKSIGGVSFIKRGRPHIESVEIIDLKDYMNMSSGEFEFLDPMHDFRDGQPIPDSSEDDGIRKHHWNYAAWDIEAWKDIKRRKPFDIERAVKVDYEVRIERLGDPAWNPTTKTCTGWPALTDLEAAHLALWQKDCGMNRISLLLIPRYGWNNTIAWLPGANQQVTGEYNDILGDGKKAHFWAEMSGLGAHGEGGVDWGYSDWPGIIGGMYDNNHSEAGIVLDISLDAVDRWITTWYSFETPLYSGSMWYSIFVYSYNYHWGVDAGTSGQRFIVYHKGRQVEFDARDVIANDNDATGEIFGWESWDIGDESWPPGSFTNFCPFTRINFKYRPYPVNSDFLKEQYPVMRYGYDY